MGKKEVRNENFRNWGRCKYLNWFIVIIWLIIINRID